MGELSRDVSRRNQLTQGVNISGFGAPVNWIAADILRIEDGNLVEHWDVIQDEAIEEQSKKQGSDVRRKLSNLRVS